MDTIMLYGIETPFSHFYLRYTRSEFLLQCVHPLFVAKSRAELEFLGRCPCALLIPSSFIISLFTDIKFSPHHKAMVINFERT